MIDRKFYSVISYLFNGSMRIDSDLIKRDQVNQF